MNLEKKFLTIWQEHVRITSSDRILIAVSTGVDSMVLLDLVAHLPQQWRPQIIVVHVNHKWRTASDEEEAFLIDYCKKRDLPLLSRQAPEDLPQTELVARNFRYDFFKEAMVESEGQALLTAHHLDDQAETLLMRLVRGGWIDRLIGIPFDRPFHTGRLIRPLLAFKKADLYDYAKTQQIPYFEDESNASLDYARNRYRQQVLPLLEAENPKASDHLAQVAEDFQQLEAVLDYAYADLSQKIGSDSGPQLAKDQLLDLPRDLARFALSRWLREELATTDVDLAPAVIDQILDWLANDQANARFEINGQWQIEKTYDVVQVKENKPLSSASVENETYTLNLNEKVDLGDFIVALNRDLQVSDQSIVVNAEDLALPLSIRHRQAGDRMRLKGSGGTKKIKDIFIDQKVPLADRDRAWLIVDAKGQLIHLLNYKESFLSVEPNTDKIQYTINIKQKE